MERISIFNYEAFYLDYLEGNLSEADTSMLLQFLEEHPECRMEDEDLVLLDDAAPMTFSGKQNLKQVDENGAIGLDNVEHFMIADAEGLLNEEKKAELNKVISENQELEAKRSRYNAVYFQPDESIVYAGKSDLKQRKRLVLWPYMSGAVAAAAVVVVMLMTGKTDDIFDGVNTPKIEVAQSGSLNEKKPVTEPFKGTAESITPIENTKSSNTSPRMAKATVSGGSTDKAVTNLTKMERRFTDGLAPSKALGDVAARPINKNTNSQLPDIDSNPDPIVTAKPMENPIEPITAFISEKAKKEVEFKRRKASENDKGGFLLKIGKFELSRNKH